MAGKKAVVVGASLGRGVAESLGAAGASVFAIARERTGLDELEAANPSVAVAVAGASPLLHPIRKDALQPRGRTRSCNAHAASTTYLRRSDGKSSDKPGDVAEPVRLRRSKRGQRRSAGLYQIKGPVSEPAANERM